MSNGSLFIIRPLLCLAVIFVLNSSAQSADIFLPIVTDTYLDSWLPDNNYGTSENVDAMISTNGFPEHGLFQLPEEVMALSTSMPIRVRVYFHVSADQTSGRNISIFPLKRPFTEGSGHSTITTDGANWDTSNGTNAWTTPGGDFDTNFPVVCNRGTNGFFWWDITPLLYSDTARSNLLAHGALLRIDETPIPTNRIAYAAFTSSEGAAAERPYVVCSLAAARTFPLATDTYLDSRSANAAKNYGAATTIKVLINSSDASVCRGLFQLPPELGLYNSGEIASAKIFCYVWQDNTTNLNITLYPLTRPFAEGTGNGTAPADGATWATADGTNAWTTAGGDFDTNFPVVGIKEEILDPDLHDRFLSWDIAPLLTNDIARSNLLANGALLMIDEVPVPATGMPRAPFTSSDDLTYAAEYRPHMDVKVVLRTPEVPDVSIADGQVTMRLGNCTPLVTNRIERTQDLLATNGWTLVTNVVATTAETNWMESLPADWTNAFYRVRIAE